MKCGKTIICGYGVVGKNAARHTLKGGVGTVAVDIKPISEFPDNLTFIEGDATDEGVMREAGIGEASTVVVATGSDVTNVFITLMAREFNPDVRILAVSRSPDNIEKLYRAGAHYVVSKALIGGRMLAKYAISPQVANFIDSLYISGGVELAQFRIGAECTITGKTLSDSRLRDVTGANVIAIERRGAVIANPPGETQLAENDLLYIIGTTEQLDRMHSNFNLTPSNEPMSGGGAKR